MKFQTSSIFSVFLFRSKKFLDFDLIALSFLFDKYCPIMGLKDPSRDLQINCAISFCFHLYLMLYECAARFDVTETFIFFFWFLR